MYYQSRLFIKVKDKSVWESFFDAIDEIPNVPEGFEKCFDTPNCPLNVFFQKPEDYKVPVEGAESFDELFKRTGEFLKEVVEPDLEAGKDVVIVGHGAMNSSIVCQGKGLALKDFWSEGIENCKLMKLK